MIRGAALALLLAGCGRLGFDPLGGLPGDDAPGDDAPIVDADPSQPDADPSQADAMPACTSWSPWSEPDRVPELSTSADDWDMSMSFDGLQMYWATVAAEPSVDLYVSARDAVGAPWGAPMKLDALCDDVDDESSPTVSATATELYYGFGEILRSARASTADAFGPGSLVIAAAAGFVQVSGAEITRDALSLYLHANSSLGGHGDLYLATRGSVAGTFGTPVMFTPTGLGIDAARFPSVSRDELELYFEREGASPTLDIYVATRASTADAWGNVTEVPNINADTSVEGDVEVSPDGTELYFGSDRPGGEGGDDTYVSTRTCL